MSTTLKGDLHGLDYSDSFEMSRRPRTYAYTLKASDGGKVSLKIESYAPAMAGERPSAATWYTLEEKSKIASGTTLTGKFTVPTTHLSSSTDAEYTLIRIKFSREALSDGVNYELYFAPE